MTIPSWIPIRWLREPLVHFLALGGLLFLAFHWGSDGGPAASRIVVTPGRVEAMASGFARVWQRPPTEPELKGLIDDYIREEIATREAQTLGLDQDDTIIRRRLRQKLEFLVEDAIDTGAPTDAELQAWLEHHAEEFRPEPQVGFAQVYFDPARHEESPEDDLSTLLARLSSATDIESLGDALMVPHHFEAATRSEIARIFGEEFASEVLKVEPGRWTGPVRSGYGLHLVRVHRRDDGHVPTLAAVRPQVEREFVAARRKRELNAMYQRLLERYQVVVESRAVHAPAAAAGSTSGPAGPR
jgi:hypothetical protein